MSDLISRKALIESYCEDNCGERRCRDSWDKCRFISHVLEQPSVTDTNVGSKWIPCSERLPEENRDGWTELILSIKTGEVILGFWHDTETGFCRRFRGGVCRTGGVIAWQPLPEPYKGETENDES